MNTVNSLTPCRNSGETSLAGFYDDCMVDACAGGRSSVDQQLCLTMDSIIAYCADMGHVVDSAWRAATDCG